MQKSQKTRVALDDSYKRQSICKVESDKKDNEGDNHDNDVDAEDSDDIVYKTYIVG